MNDFHQRTGALYFYIFSKMEKIIETMQDETNGVPVRTVKSFLTKIPSVFTGVGRF